MKKLQKYHYHHLIGFSLLSALVFIIIAAIISYNIEIERANHQTKIMINQLISTIESTANIAAYTNNQELAIEVLDGLLRNDIIYKATLDNDQAMHLEKSRGNEVNQTKEIVKSLYSPFDDKRVVGQLKVTANLEFILYQAKHTALMNALNAFVLVCITLFVMFLLIRTFFAKPLSALSNMLNTIIGRESIAIKPLESVQSNELNNLVSGINTTLEALATQKKIRKQVESEEKRLRNIFESTSAGIFLLDEYGIFLVCTPTLLKIVGLEHTDSALLAGQNFAELFFKEPSQFNQLLINANQYEQLETADLMLASNGFSALWVHCLVSKIVDNNNNVLFEGALFDISKRIAAEKKILYEASYDGLTGLLRRKAAEDNLRKKIELQPDFEPIILLLDLDGFKKINDTHGHNVGDIVLVQVAKRLLSCVRQSDMVCRLGGDEFFIILFNCSEVEDSVDVAKKIIKSVSESIVIDGSICVTVGVSIGIAVLQKQDNNKIELERYFKAADEAMYRVKRQGKNGYAIAPRQ